MLRRVETEKISYQRLGSCVSWTSFGRWREGGGLLKWHAPVFGDFCCEIQIAESDHRKKNLSINHSVEALIQLKEGYQGQLKLHLHLRGIPVWEKKEFCLKRKNKVWWSIFMTYWNLVHLLKGTWWVLLKKKCM